MIRGSGTDPASPSHRLPGEILLIGAILRQALVDARGNQPIAQQQAIAFLMDDWSINWWAELVGADGEVLASALRVAAKLE